MTRLGYWIKAKTLYDIHSPFVYDLCRNVLYARAPEEAVAARDGHTRRFATLLYMLKDYLSLSEMRSEGNTLLLGGNDTWGRVLMVDAPHADRKAEHQWTALCADEAYRVSIDLYDVGLLFTNSHLHRQHFLLR
ncbi:MAG: hypothetical protein IJR13_07285 [Bacteroidales bacterium]|nr:hypothetical protein [Bacteroidales bacterium]